MDNIQTFLKKVVDAMEDYDQLTESIIALSDAVLSTDTDEFVWGTENDTGEWSLMSVIVGAYWHYSEWHNGQYHKTYAALCILGQIFSPGCESGPDSLDETEFYEHMNELAERHYGMP